MSSNGDGANGVLGGCLLARVKAKAHLLVAPEDVRETLIALAEQYSIGAVVRASGLDRGTIRKMMTGRPVKRNKIAQLQRQLRQPAGLPAAGDPKSERDASSPA